MTEEVGFAKTVKEFLVHLDGLPTAKVNDLIESDTGILGWVSALQPNHVEALLLTQGEIKPGELFKKVGKSLTIPVGNFLLGRAIDPLGVPIDGKGLLAQTKTDTNVTLDKIAPGISQREFINNQFKTGNLLVDTLIPVGKGQRELIVGDARCGKTSFLVNTIINQGKSAAISRQSSDSLKTDDSQVICIYAAIGKPITEVNNLIQILHINKADAFTIVVAASSSDPAPLIYLTPQTAFSIAEYFQTRGSDVLIILDDLGNHAKIYREIALLGDRTPGRESYPGDIFYQHAHLLERAGNFSKEIGGGSITALPVIELNLNDFTTFIPTNLMAMTDGHLLFKSSLFNKGQRPAVDISLSVSRVGQQSQTRVQNLLSTRIKQILAEAVQYETISRFSFELPPATRLTLHLSELITEMIKQQTLTFIPIEIQTILLGLIFTKFMQDKDREYVRLNKQAIIEAFSTDPTLLQFSQSVLSFKDDKELFTKLEEIIPVLEKAIG